MRSILLPLLSLLLPALMFAAPPPGIPDGWSDGYAYANGIRLHYYRAAPAPGKPVMVMVHGVTDIGLNWLPLASQLQNDYDIYMLDARGHGLSDPFTASDDGNTLVKDVVAFVQTMGFEKPILVGHSMGAATVMRLGAEYPDLAKAIVMVDPGLGPRPPGPRREESKSGATPTPPPPASRESTAPDRLSVNMRGTPEELVAQNNYRFEDLVATSQRRHPKWSLSSHQYWALSKKQYHGPYSEQTWQGMSGTMRTGEALAKIQVPALILKAEASPEARETHQEAISGNPNIRLVHVEGGGHNLHHDEPARTLEILNQFLANL